MLGRKKDTELVEKKAQKKIKDTERKFGTYKEEWGQWLLDNALKCGHLVSAWEVATNHHNEEYYAWLGTHHSGAWLKPHFAYCVKRAKAIRRNDFATRLCNGKMPPDVAKIMLWWEAREIIAPPKEVQQTTDLQHSFDPKIMMHISEVMNKRRDKGF